MLHDDQFQQVVHHVLQVVRTMVPQHLAMGDDQLRGTATDVVQAWQTFGEQLDMTGLQTLGAKLAAYGFPPRICVQLGRALKLHTPTNGAQDIDALIDEYQSALLEGYVEGAKRTAKQATITDMQATQRREDQLRAVIQELSTPIIPIYRGVLVLPLVGAIDSLRAQEITERLLEEIVRQQADLVIIDITGVSVVDTSVANHLIMTAQAVSLLGSRVIFTGISTMIAQTIIQLGINMGDVITLSNLQAGMQFALEQLGLEIAPLAA